MSRYESKTVTVEKPIDDMFNRFSDLSLFEKRIQELPDDKRAQLGDVHFSADAISIVTPQVGELKFQIVERCYPDKIVFGSPGAPINLNMSVNFAAVSESATNALQDGTAPAPQCFAHSSVRNFNKQPTNSVK